MKIYFAAIGSDLWNNFTNAKAENVLFSYFDQTEMAGFKFRKWSWRNLVEGHSNDETEGGGTSNPPKSETRAGD